MSGETITTEDAEAAGTTGEAQKTETGSKMEALPTENVNGLDVKSASGPGEVRQPDGKEDGGEAASAEIPACGKSPQRKEEEPAAVPRRWRRRPEERPRFGKLEIFGTKKR